jgi:bis(5'-nucleosyl)-tetraphosphatase (symmetrical)
MANMAYYVIGDIHGCFDTLMSLLKVIQFNPACDTMVCVGDLVGRGPKPLEVLRYVLNTSNVHCTLGNHDLWCMAIAYGCYDDKTSEFHNLFKTPEDMQLLDQWRLSSKMLIHNNDLKIIVTHAGLPPQWSLPQAKALAEEMEHALHGRDFKSVLAALEGDEPHCWDESLMGARRYRYIVNALTRMRFCDKNGCLDFKEKDVIQSCQEHLKPWFEWPHHLDHCRLFFGHWAALKGVSSKANIIGTDTGCVYGGFLTAYKVQDPTSLPLCFRVPYQEN